MRINRIIKYIGERNNQYKDYEKLGLINDNNQKEGCWKDYHENGKLSSKGNYVNGVRDGYWEFYYGNEHLYIKGYYVNGNQEGYWEYYHSDGDLWFKRNYVNGLFYEDE